MCCKDKITSNGRTVGYCLERAIELVIENPCDPDIGDFLKAAEQAVNGCPSCSPGLQDVINTCAKEFVNTMNSVNNSEATPNIMFCSRCGKQIDAEALICVHCGVGTEKYRQEQAMREASTPVFQQPNNDTANNTYQQEPLAPGRKLILIPCLIWLASDIFNFFNSADGSIIQLFGDLYFIEGIGSPFIQMLFLLAGLFLSLVFILGIIFHKNISKGELLRKLGTAAIVICVINGTAELIANEFNGFGWVMFFGEGLNISLCALYRKGAKKNYEAYEYGYSSYDDSDFVEIPEDKIIDTTNWGCIKCGCSNSNSTFCQDCGATKY